jgi:hypothetical protein
MDAAGQNGSSDFGWIDRGGYLLFCIQKMIAVAYDFAVKVKNPPWVPAAVLIAIGIMVFVLRKR